MNSEKDFHNLEPQNIFLMIYDYDKALSYDLLILYEAINNNLYQ